MYDSCADVSLCNMRDAFMKGSLRKTTTAIGGVDAQVSSNNANESNDMMSYYTGDIEILLGGKKYVLRDICYVDERLHEDEVNDDRMTLLISTRMMAKYNKLGTDFIPGGKYINFYTQKEGKRHILEQVFVGIKEDSYIQRAPTKNDRNRNIIRASHVQIKTNKAKPIPNSLGGASSEEKVDGDVFKDAPKAGPKQKVAKDILTCQNSVENSDKQTKKEEVKHPKDSRKLAQTLHDRMHFGKTRPVINFLKEAYGLTEKDFSKLFEEPCEGCDTAKAKLSKPVHKAERSKPQKPGERLVWDIFTSPKRTKDGIKYLLVIVDVYSDRIWVYGLKRKSQASKFLCQLIKRCERDSKTVKPKSIQYCGAKTPIIQGLRADGGGENWTKKIRNLTDKLGISREESIAYCQYQNGIAERTGAIVWENGQAMRINANLPESDWLRSMCTYAYVKNRLPNAADPSRTPIERFYDFKAKPLDLVDNFKTFGCLCVVNVPKDVRKSKGKLSPKGYRAIFLGYSDECPELKNPKSRGYIIQAIGANKLKKVAAHQVFKFYEKIFPAKHPHIYKHDYYDDDVDAADVSDEGNGTDDDTPELVSDSDDDENDEDDGDDDDENDHFSELFVDSNGDNHTQSESKRHTRSSERFETKITENEHVFQKKVPKMMNENDENDDDDEIDVLGLEVPDLETVHDDSKSDVDVNDIDYDAEYTLENVVAHKFSKNGGTNFLCQWDIGGEKYTYSYEPRSDLRGQELEAHILYENNMKHDKDKTYLVNDVTESKCGPGLNEYEHDHPLIKTVYEERGWDHTDNIPKTTPQEEGDLTTFDANVSKKINVVRKRIRKIKRIITNIKRTEERDQDDDRHDYVTELDDEIYIENQRIKILKAAKFKNKTKIREKGGVVIPDNYRKAKPRADFEKWKGAMDVEWKSFHDKDVIEYVKRPSLPQGSNIVSVRWVYDVKLENDMQTIKKYKARLVARGFSQREGIDYDDIFAPTMNLKSMRILLALAARDGIEVQQYDVSNAFLHATLDFDVFIDQPEGYDDQRYPRDEYVIKLKRAMYGLKNASRAWSLHLMSALKNLGFAQNSKDDCLWSIKRGNTYLHYLFHVDDIMVVCNDDKLRDEMFDKLKTVMDIRNEGPMTAFLALRITRTENGSYAMDQQNYIEKIAARFGVTSDRKKKRKTPGEHGFKLTNDSLPTTNEGKRDALKYDMPGLVGALIYTIRTRFDVSFAISDVSRFMAQWGKPHYDHAIRILEYLYDTRERKILMNTDLLQGELKFTLYVDANYGDDRESLTEDVKWKSQGGFMLFLGGVLVSWGSRRHHIRVLSSMESEYVEASDASKEVLWGRQLITEAGHKQHDPTIIYEDNKACIDFTKLGKITERNKHIDIRKYFLKQLQNDKYVDIKHISTDIQLADMMTKYTLVNPFVTMRDVIFDGIKCHDKYAHSLSAKQIKQQAKQQQA